MSETKQAPQHKPKRSCSILCTILKVTIAIIIAFGIAVLISWLIVRPTKVKFSVVSADLAQFHLTNGNTLNYSLSVNIVIRNPNKKVGIYYDKLQAIALYQGERFGWTPLPQFYQSHKNTTNLRANFRGQSMIVLRGFGISKFNHERNAGVYLIDVEIYGWTRFKAGAVKSRRFKPKVECNLRIPLDSNDTLATGFESTRCSVDL